MCLYYVFVILVYESPFLQLLKAKNIGVTLTTPLEIYPNLITNHHLQCYYSGPSHSYMLPSPLQQPPNWPVEF